MLAGTLTVPDRGRAPFAAVVLVHGSGPMDRDETIGPNAVFLQLSNALSNAGYAVLRYDKRGVGKSGGANTSGTRDDLLADVKAAYRFARAQHEVDPKHVYLLGHSEGGELVPTVASQEPGIAGIILMAPPSLPLRQVLMQQALAGVPPAQRAAMERQELAAFDKITNGNDAKDAWYRSSMDVDPVVDIARVRSPILILQGEGDAQVSVNDLPRLANAARAANNDVTVRTFSNDNHLFEAIVSSEPQTPLAAVKQYLTVPARIDARVLDTLASVDGAPRARGRRPMNEVVVAGAGIALLGLAVAVFAKPLARSQERVVTMLPQPIRRFYRIIGAGAPFDSPPWVAHNRIGGLLVLLLGTLVAAFTAIRP